MKPKTEDLINGKDLEDALKEYQTIARSASARDESFWNGQRLAVMARIGERKPGIRLKPVLVWGLAAVVIAIVISMQVEGPRALPAPDFAGGYDQDLLGDVDRLLNESVPSALEPAMLLVDEIDAASAGQWDYGKTKPPGK